MKVQNIWNLIWFHIVTSYVIQLQDVEFISIIDRTATFIRQRASIGDCPNNLCILDFFVQYTLWS